MIKLHTSELDGVHLAQAVAIASGQNWRFLDNPYARNEASSWLLQVYVTDAAQPYWTLYNPAKSWGEGGPIIYQARISVVFYPEEGESNYWTVFIRASDDEGPATPHATVSCSAAVGAALRIQRLHLAPMGQRARPVPPLPPDPPGGDQRRAQRPDPPPRASPAIESLPWADRAS